jgi:hypothetical protein
VSIAPEPRRPTGETRPSASDDGMQHPKQGDYGSLFYERLKQAGQLIDVDPSTDIAALPHTSPIFGIPMAPWSVSASLRPHTARNFGTSSA